MKAILTFNRLSSLWALRSSISSIVSRIISAWLFVFCLFHFGEMSEVSSVSVGCESDESSIDVVVFTDDCEVDATSGDKEETARHKSEADVRDDDSFMRFL